MEAQYTTLTETFFKTALATIVAIGITYAAGKEFIRQSDIEAQKRGQDHVYVGEPLKMIFSPVD